MHLSKVKTVLLQKLHAKLIAFLQRMECVELLVISPDLILPGALVHNQFLYTSKRPIFTFQDAARAETG